MIVDSHVHIFRHWSEACGLPSREIHWKYIQNNVARPSARVYRKRDGKQIEKPHLLKEKDTTWNDLRDDVNFRVGTMGRMEYTVAGEDYYIQYMPVGMVQQESSPEFMVTQMNAAGVDHCVLQAGFTYGYMNDYNALAQREFPERITGLFHVNEPLGDDPYWMEEARRAIQVLGLKGMYFSLDGYSRYGFEWWFDDKRFDAFWEQIDSFQIPVYFEIEAIPNGTREDFLGIVKRLNSVMERMPHTRWVLVLQPPVGYFAKDSHWDIPEAVHRMYARENVVLELCFPIAWGAKWDYPYPLAQALIKALRDTYGAEKFVWGTDMPNVERFCTYRQCVDYIRAYCGFLTAREKDLILGDTLNAFCGFNIGRG